MSHTTITRAILRFIRRVEAAAKRAHANRLARQSDILQAKLAAEVEFRAKAHDAYVAALSSSWTKASGFVGELSTTQDELAEHRVG